MTNRTFALIAIALLGSSFFFSGTETGFLALDHLNLKHMVRKGSKQAAALLKLYQKKELVLATLLVGNNIANIALSALTTSFLYDRFGPKAPILAIAAVTPMILLFGEILPKSIYLARGRECLFATRFLIQFFAFVFRPFAAAAVAFPKWIIKDRSAEGAMLTREDLNILVKTGTVTYKISHEERMMIGRLLEMKKRQVIKAMKPITDVVMIPDTAKIRDVYRTVRKYGVSRLPVYSGDRDNIIGVVSAVDLLRASDPGDSIQPFITPPFYIPEQKVIIHMFEDRYEEYEMAIVLDEYGIPSGIITLEDLVEEITGDILDEYDREMPLSYKLESGAYIVESKISVKEFNERVSPIIPPGDYLTVAGFLAMVMQKVPASGDEYRFGNARFSVLDATEKRLGRVLVNFEKDRKFDKKRESLIKPSN